MFMVLPNYYEMWSWWYNLHFLCGNFVAISLITNLVALILVDTSVKGRVMATELLPGWRFCMECESFVPPRSWHCETCRTCILKRDHHCFFVGCCVGHDNARFFLVFCLYMVVATIYCTYFNSFFVWEHVSFNNKWAILKMIFPLAMLVLDISPSQIYILMYFIVVFGLIFTAILLWFHTSLLLSGQTTHERNFNIDGYESPSVLKSVELVLGVKWYLTWISPFIPSQIPHNGIQWNVKETIKNK